MLNYDCVHFVHILIYTFVVLTSSQTGCYGGGREETLRKTGRQWEEVTQNKEQEGRDLCNKIK